MLLAGCTSGGSSAAGSTPTATATDIASISVSGAFGSKPIVKVPTPFSVSSTVRKVLVAGTGAVTKAGQRVTVDYLGINGTDGKQFDTSWGRTPSNFVLDGKQYLPGLVTGLTGVNVGSRVLIVVPPKDGYGVQGSAGAGIGPTDTLVVVADVKAAKEVLTRATGTPVAPKKGLPTVQLDKAGKPTITLPAGAPPTTLVAQPLILGNGPKVTKGQQIIVNYTGVIWPGGKVFDSSWATGRSPASFQIGVGKVIAGWDTGLVGQPIGSQILLVVPPAQGYGANGNDQAGIKGTDTLVFVVDLLDAG